MKFRIFIPFILVFLALVSCQKRIQQFAYQDAKTIRFDSTLIAKNDLAVERIIEPYKSKLDALMNEVIGSNAYEMTKGKPSSTLTNFCADAALFGYEESTGKDLDVVIMNFGGIRLNSFGAGDILVGEIYEVMPFDNEFYILEMGNKDLKKLLDMMAKSGGWPISAGSGFSISKDSIADKIVIAGVPYDNNKIYKVGLPDYVANGGDGNSFLKNLPKTDTDLLIRDLMIKYVRTKKNIQADKSSRIKKSNND
jgi:2',3'-cyclic-nucleotide 2'-phosphodiesterase (5'-nucleotidase family)